jgi:putative glutamine amidotransferase
MMNKRNILSLFLLFLFFCFAGCTHVQEEEPVLKIAISKGMPLKSYGHYSEWLKKADSTVTWADMYHQPIDSALLELEGCHGLLVTGGTDVNPGIYGRAFDTVRCWPLDHKRDSLEIALINRALELGIPVMGICRGEQILNVALGGSLYVDLPEDIGTMVTHQCEDKSNCYHPVRIKPGSILSGADTLKNGEVNSNHHQGINKLSDKLVAIAHTRDALIEAVEWKNTGEDMRFVLGVQWHPERMDFENPLSGPLAIRFLEEARDYAHKDQLIDTL